MNSKLVVITGGAGRIGSVFARAVAENFGKAVIADIDEEFGRKTISNIVESTADKSIVDRIFFKEVDISSHESVAQLVSDLRKEHSKIDALVNNAYPRNKNYGKSFFEINSNDFSDFLTLHLGGYFNISQHFIRLFLEQGYGNIINISSIQGVAAPAFETYEGTAMHSPVEYTVAKHGLIGMTKYMAKMFKKEGIRVNAISPGGILAGQPERFLMQYKKRCGTKGMLDSSDLTGALLYLLSDASKYMTGQNLIVDDGFGL
ncbi:oxidoreductase [Stutzerimonas nitrititolerans]|uniref:oxidoreductase n=1 Tax=Stutzerimonas nitrititolerans TaxID=2482751 RepID=UPI0028ABCB49|nr:oxidoreductase [Stutzerimonas nitrititolerans]